MKNGWTGGQYSLFRVALGLYLLWHFAALLPWGAELFSSRGVLADGTQSPLLLAFPNVLALWDGPGFVTALLGLGVVLAFLLALGWRDRWAALLLWYLWACLFGRNPLISNPGLPYVGLLLVVHALLPRAPFGSLEARGRVDPGTGWRLPPPFFGVVWALMALGYSYSGYTKLVSPSWQDGTAVERLLTNPLVRPTGLRTLLLELPDFLLHTATYGALAMELGFVLLALSRKLRPWAWGAMLGMHCGLILLIDFVDLSLGMVMLHLFTFDPHWVRPRRANEPETVYYDGACGLCHGVVRLVLSEDRDAAYRFAPLESDAFAEDVPRDVREELPDTLIVRTARGRLHLRSSAVAHILLGLGGLWGVLGRLLSCVPGPLRDTGYDLIAGARRSFFPTPKAACPLVPEVLEDRFLA